MFKRKKAVTLGEAKMRINSEYGNAALHHNAVTITDEPTTHWCKHADQVNLKVARLQDTLYYVFELLNAPRYAVRKGRKHFGNFTARSEDRYDVIDQVTGDVTKSFLAAHKGELLAQTLCDALNAEETTQRAKAKQAKEPGLCNCGDKDCSLSVTEDHITEPDGVQRNEEKAAPVCHCGTALVCPAYIADEHK